MANTLLIADRKHQTNQICVCVYLLKTVANTLLIGGNCRQVRGLIVTARGKAKLNLNNDEIRGERGRYSLRPSHLKMYKIRRVPLLLLI